VSSSEVCTNITLSGYAAHTMHGSGKQAGGSACPDPCSGIPHLL
jgi:hypothetical protein